MTDASACNYDADATDEDGSCTYAEDGYDCDGVCLNDADGDGVRDEFEIAGCEDDSACNYNADATDEDGSCTYAEEGYDCDGVCLNDTDGDGICDEFEIAGCTDPAAANYDPFATDDDASCLEPICIDPEACNYTEWSGNDYCLIVQPYQVHDGGDLDGYVTYRVYIKTQNSDDFISSVTGDSEFPTRIQSSGDFYQSAFGGLLGSDQTLPSSPSSPKPPTTLTSPSALQKKPQQEKETSTPLNRRSTRGAPTSKTDKTSSSMTPSEVDGSSSTETPTVWPVTTSRYSLHKSPPTACSPVPSTFRYSSTEIRTPTTASSSTSKTHA